MTLDEIQLSTVPAAFEPALDYVVTKMARFPFDKFTDASSKLSTQMKATGEVMSIGRTIEESLLKAVRSLEIGVCHLHMPKFDNKNADELLTYIKDGTDDRIFAIAQLIRLGTDLEPIHEATQIDMLFLEKFKNIVSFEKTVAEGKNDLDVLCDFRISTSQSSGVCPKSTSGTSVRTPSSSPYSR